MRLVWTPEASDDLANISAYIALDSERAARDTVRRLIRGAGTLTGFPRMGRPGRVPGTREFVYPRLPYIAIYTVGEDRVSILRILHSAQDRPTIR